MVDERKAAILRAVIEQYTETAEPVGSTAVAEAAGLKVSSATIRNEMAALEADGYLTQPHTSAGRVPTEMGYRFFVDDLDSGQLSAVLSGAASTTVAGFFSQLQGEIEQVMKETASLLTNLTDYAAVVVDDTGEAATVRSVQLVALAERTVMAVTVLSTGQLLKHTIDFDAPIAIETVEEAGRSLRNAVGSTVATMPAPEPSADDAAGALARQFHQAISANPSEAEKVYVDGTSKVASAFEAVDSVSRVLTILEQQLVVVSLLADVVERGLSVAIGTETGVAPLAECSLVVSPYDIDGEHAGSIAVLGPTRMNYPQAMSAVAVVSNQLGRLLSEG